MKTHPHPCSFRRTIGLILAGSISVLLGGQSAQAATVVWSGGSGVDGGWANTDNWFDGVAPGATSGTTNLDIALFNAAIPSMWGSVVGNPIVIDAGRNLLGIDFELDAGNYFVGGTVGGTGPGGNALHLTSGGAIRILDNLTGSDVIETINAPLVIESMNYGFYSAGEYTLSNDSGAGAGTLMIDGDITGSAGIGTNLNLAGSNTNENTISGSISDGAADRLNLLKSGEGKWILSGANTYSGGTYINAGTLEIAPGGSITSTIPSYGNIYVAFGAGQHGSLVISGGTMTNAVSYLGVEAGAEGTATISAGNWTTLGEHSIGYFGTGTLNIDGGTVTGASEYGSAYVGRYAGSMGTVNMTSGAWNNGGPLSGGPLYVGYEGTGVVNLSGTAAKSITSNTNIFVGYEAGSSGTVNLSGSGGGTIASTFGTYLGFLAGSTGTLDVTGGPWTIDSGVQIGWSGTGHLNLHDGDLTTLYAEIGGIVADPFSISTATIDHGTWTNTYGLGIGGIGPATLVIGDGSTVADGDESANSSVGPFGTVSVSTGGQWINRGNLSIAGLLSINGGTVASQTGGVGGTATISGGKWNLNGPFSVAGTVNLHGGEISDEIGYVGGTATITGGTWNNSSAFYVGYFDTGTLNLSGGTLSDLSGLIGGVDQSHGTATVSGTGTWTNSDTLYVGYQGTGTLNIDGGTVTSYYGIIGNLPTSTGAATISNGGIWDNQYLYVGAGGTGSLNIDGGTITAKQSYIGSRGTATITSGSWTTTEGLSVEGSTIGATLHIHGGNVFADYTAVGLPAGQTGAVTITGGALASSLSVGGAGTGTLDISGGSVSGYFAGLGLDPTGRGIATITDGTWDSTEFYAGYYGTGTVNLYGGSVNVDGGAGNLTLALVAGSFGTLNLGNGITAGALNVADIHGGDGTALVNFDLPGDADFGRRLTGSLAVRKLGPNSLTLLGDNTYTGPTTVSAGTLRAGVTSVPEVSGAFGKNSPITLANVAGAVLDLANFDTQIGSLTGGGTIGGNVTLGTATLTVGGDHTSPAGYAGVISGAGSLTKIGTGTQTLAGANTYTGPTTITAGGLTLVSPGSLDNTAIGVTGAGSTFSVRPGTGAVAVGLAGAGVGGATLDLDAGTVFSMQDGAKGTFHLQQEADFGAGTTALTLNGATLHFDLGSTGADLLAVGVGRAVVTGTNTIGLHGFGSGLTDGEIYNLITASQGLTGTFQFPSGLTTQIASVGGTPYSLTLLNSDFAQRVQVGSASANLSWTGQALGTGAHDSNWNTTTGTNWASSTAFMNYADGFNAIFRDTNAVSGGSVANSVVVLQSAGVSPASVHFDHSAVNYTVGNISGHVGITGATGLRKQGTGTLTLTGVNSYTGTTTVNVGLLEVASGGEINHPTSDLRVGDADGDDGALLISGGSVTNHAGFLAYDFGSTGAATISDGTWSNQSGLSIGREGVGTLLVNGGSVASDYAILGETDRGTGSVAISSGTWSNNLNLTVGNSGTGTLTVNGGSVTNGDSYLGFYSGSTGAVTISAGTWRSSGDLIVGNSGAGTLVVNGGSVASGYSYLGREEGSTGSATISSGSWHAGSELSVGGGGVGALTVSGGSVMSGDGYVGRDAGSTGAATISSGSWDNSGDLSVGSSGTAVLTVNGGTLSNRTGSVGVSSGSVGTATISSGSWSNFGNLIVGLGGAGTLTVGGGSVTNINGDLGRDAGATGAATITGGTWSNSAELSVGRAGAGTLTISGGGVTNTNGFLGRDVGSSGSATISSGTWSNSGDLNVGYNGSGTLTVNGGSVANGTGLIGVFSGSTGAATISSGSWSNSGDLTVGHSGTGTLAVSGGSVTNIDGYLGRVAGSTGAATISGGTWSSSGLLTVGLGGTGVLTVNGGSVTSTAGLLADFSNSVGEVTISSGGWDNSGNLTVGNFGMATLTVSGGSVTNDDADLGRNYGSIGAAVISSGSWISSGALTIGVAGNGTLALSGGSVTSRRSTLADGPGTSGTATITGGTWSNDLDLTVGLGGAGTLTVNGGSVTSSTGIIGHLPSGIGEVTIGSGTWSNEFDLTVGHGGSGTLTVNGGSVTSGTGTLGSFFNSTGVATITSGTWSISGDLYLGYQGVGTLTVNGGSVTSEYSYLGLEANSTGAATVTSGTWSSSLALVVGSGGTGTLNVSGGSVTSGAGILGDGGGSIGEATIAGGSWSSDSNLIVGLDGVGTLSLTESGAALIGSGTGALFLAAGPSSIGTLNLGTGSAAGTLNAAVVTAGSGSATVNFHHTGGHTFAPQLTGNLAVNKLGSGTTFLTGTNSYTGVTAILAGTLEIQASVLNSADGPLGNATSAILLGEAGSSVAATLQTNAPSPLTIERPITVQAGSGSRIVSNLGLGLVDIRSSFDLHTDLEVEAPFTAGDIVLTGSLSESVAGSGLRKTGTGQAIVTGSNSFTGTTTVSAGTLQLDRSTPDNAAIPTDGNTATTSDIVIDGGDLVLAASEQIGDTGSITMHSGSFGFSGGGKTETIDKLTTIGGIFTTGANTLEVLGATVTWSGGTNTVSTGGVVSDKHWEVTGGTNTVQQGGILRVQSGTGTTGLHFGGTSSPTITLDSHATDPGVILLKQDVFVDNTLTSGTAQILNTAGGSLRGQIDMNGGTRTFDIGNNNGATTDLLISAEIANGALTKTGAGTLTLTGANTFAGATLVNDGTLEAGGDGALAATSGITVNTGGTLLLSNSGTTDRINNSAPVTLAGGKIAFSGNVTEGSSPGTGALTLSANSIIDFGGGNDVFNFGASGSGNPNPWTTLTTLSIWNWGGSYLGGGNDRLIFGSASNSFSLTTGQLGQINFYSDAGETFLGVGGFVGSFGEVVPVPEPASVFVGLAMCGLAGWRERRRGQHARRADRRL
jgi:autotransporter-associated beta strand protein/T5SS/PEP-CTERM-associated repeat protein